MSNNADARQLPVNLFTRSGYAIPASTYFIPADWRRYQLSELINKVLGHGGDSGVAPVPFDFVVEGEVLRGSLESWVKANRGDDEETAINVEYMQSVLPPSDAGRWEQEDWVSGLSVQRRGTVLVSSYLSHVRVLPLAQGLDGAPSPLYTLPLPTSLGATCCTWLDDDLVAAGGVDRATHVFRLPSLDPAVAASENNTAPELYTLMGHAAPIAAIAGRGRELASAAWDGAVNLYVLPSDEPTEHELPADPTSYLPGQKKRRKLMKENKEGPAPIEGLTDGDATGESGMGWRRAPTLSFHGHKGRVGGLVWDYEDNTIWSAGWDGTVRAWDAETGANAVTRQGPADKALLCLDQFKGTGQLAAGSMDRTVTLWDTRQAASVIAATLNVGSPVPSITCHPTSNFTLATATYAGNVQIWDTRSPKHALFSVRHSTTRTETKNGKALGERLLAVDWDGELLVAGGEDGEVGLWRARGE